MSYSHEKRYQTLLDFLYCKCRKAGQGLGTRLLKMGVHIRVEVLHTTLCDTTSLSVPLIVCSYLEHLCNQVTVPLKEWVRESNRSLEYVLYHLYDDFSEGEPSLQQYYMSDYQHLRTCLSKINPTPAKTCQEHAKTCLNILIRRNSWGCPLLGLTQHILSTGSY